MYQSVALVAGDLRFHRNAYHLSRVLLTVSLFFRVSSKESRIFERERERERGKKEYECFPIEANQIRSTGSKSAERENSRKFASARMTSRIARCKQVCICNRTVCRDRYIYIYIYIYIYTTVTYVHTYIHMCVYNIYRFLYIRVRMYACTNTRPSLYIIMAGTQAPAVNVCA